jgi:SAM-dependent methyltransferase
MVENDKKAGPLFLNLGAGHTRVEGFLSVDLYGTPDVRHDLNKAPYPWPDNSVDRILASHIMEHLDDWWTAVTECARILRPGGLLEIRVPHDSSTTALEYRDHKRIIGPSSFHGTLGQKSGESTWAESVRDTVPILFKEYVLHPHVEYQWMATWCPWLLRFCARHMRNFIWEHRMVFEKIGDSGNEIQR